MYGPLLKKLRESKSLTQAQVARSVGISPAQLARLESNQRGLYVADFVSIAQALGEKPGNLLPNDLGEIGHLKPLIDRLSGVEPALLAQVAGIIDRIVQLAQDAGAQPKKVADARESAASPMVSPATRKRRPA